METREAADTRPRTLERTFGLEMEFADVDKNRTALPTGFEWDKVETIHNTDGTVGTYTGRYGGEINTPPMLLNHGAKESLRGLLRSLKDNGAVARRDLALQVHIFIGDLDVEQVKAIFFLCYHTSGILKELCHEPPYSDEQRYRPSPTLEYYRRISAAGDFRTLRQVLENSSNKGWVRFFVNISSFFVRETVEFRLFNATLDFWQLMNCVMFAYRFVDYALRHTEDDFRAIRTADDFVRETRVPRDLPVLPPELLYFADLKSQDAGLLLHRMTGISNAMLGVVSDNIGGEVSFVNPFLYSAETRLFRNKKIRIYNNDEFHHCVYLSATGQLKITYSGMASFLQDFSGDEPAGQVACLLIMKKLTKFFADSEYAQKNLDAYASEMDVTFDKALNSARRICEMLEVSQYRHGTLNDALADGGEVFFQFDNYHRFRTTMGAIRRHSDYDLKFERKRTLYNGIPGSLGNAASLCMVSRNPFLPMEKLAKSGDTFLYKTGDGASKISFKSKVEEPVTLTEAPDDLKIENKAEIRIRPVKSAVLRQAQERYVKKVEKISGCRFGCLVFYGKYLIGGFGFNLPLQKEYDVWLLSDFCTNNRIPRLSKLILLLVRSKEVKRHLSRRLHREARTCYTKVYTHAPVSMKYRGSFRLAARESNHLLYTTELGSAGDMDDVFGKYREYLKRM